MGCLIHEELPMIIFQKSIYFESNKVAESCVMKLVVWPVVIAFLCSNPALGGEGTYSAEGLSKCKYNKGYARAKVKIFDQKTIKINSVKYNLRDKDRRERLRRHLKSCKVKAALLQVPRNTKKSKFVEPLAKAALKNVNQKYLKDRDWVDRKFQACITSRDLKTCQGAIRSVEAGTLPWFKSFSGKIPKVADQVLAKEFDAYSESAIACSKGTPSAARGTAAEVKGTLESCRSAAKIEGKLQSLLAGFEGIEGVDFSKFDSEPVGAKSHHSVAALTTLSSRYDRVLSEEENQKKALAAKKKAEEEQRMKTPPDREDCFYVCSQGFTCDNKRFYQEKVQCEAKQESCVNVCSILPKNNNPIYQLCMDSYPCRTKLGYFRQEMNRMRNR
jgi:hypothetical protein